LLIRVKFCRLFKFIFILDVIERESASTSVVPVPKESSAITANLDMFPFFVYEKDETTSFRNPDDEVLPEIEGHESETGKEDSDKDEEDDMVSPNGFVIDENDGPFQVILVSLWYFW